MIEDLLFAMTSIEGVYIKRKRIEAISHRGEQAIEAGNGGGSATHSEYVIEPYLPQPSCDFSLQFLVNKMLPLCNNHDFI